MPANPDSRRNAQSIGVFVVFIVIVIFFFGLYNSASTIPPAPVSSPPSPMTEDKPIQASQSPSKFVVKDVTEQIKETVKQDVRSLVTKAQETEPGRLVVYTTIVDPRGEDDSVAAWRALRICNGIVHGGGYEHISVMEYDRTTFVLYGHPSVPVGECGEV